MGSTFQASQILTQWGKKFGALVVIDPQIQPIRIRFLTNVRTPLTWGDQVDLRLLRHRDRRELPAPGGLYVIRAHHRRQHQPEGGPALALRRRQVTCPTTTSW
ncbi:MAG: hypothetical protein KIT58_02925 [Planctomycetota bacterium]|nr:hypothetical protein [Planctomycetota bacterium]